MVMLSIYDFINLHVLSMRVELDRVEILHVMDLRVIITSYVEMYQEHIGVHTINILILISVAISWSCIS